MAQPRASRCFPPPDRNAGVVPPPRPLAVRRGEPAAQHADRRRLPRAVRSQEAEDLSLPHLEAHPVDRGERAEPFHEVAHHDGVFFRRASHRSLSLPEETIETKISSRDGSILRIAEDGVWP